MFDDMTDDVDPPSARPPWLRWVVVPATLIWLGATAVAIVRLLVHLGDQAYSNVLGDPTSTAFGRLDVWAYDFSVRPEVVTAVLIAVGPPAVGLLVAVCWRRPLTSVLLTLSGVIGGLGLVALTASCDPPPQVDPPRGCVELSGGPSDCP